MSLQSSMAQFMSYFARNSVALQLKLAYYLSMGKPRRLHRKSGAVVGTTASGCTYIAATALTMEDCLKAKAILERALGLRPAEVPDGKVKAPPSA